MHIEQSKLTRRTRGKGFHEVTDQIREAVAHAQVRTGWVHVFCMHTSCSLMLMENADPSARRDLQAWMDRLVPEDDPHFEHTLEGADDMPSHIKMALTRTSETLPIMDGSLALGTWQGLFLWEHREQPHERTLIVTVQGRT